jgi:hypothetical protein
MPMDAPGIQIGQKPREIAALGLIGHQRQMRPTAMRPGPVCMHPPRHGHGAVVIARRQARR